MRNKRKNLNFDNFLNFNAQQQNLGVNGIVDSKFKLNKSKKCKF